jgi:hypothetical protein
VRAVDVPAGRSSPEGGSGVPGMSADLRPDADVSTEEPDVHEKRKRETT